MKRANLRSGRAFTLIEMLVAIFVIAVLAALILPGLERPRHNENARCANNLKQIGLSFRVWSTDNNDRFPMSYYTNSSGEMLLANVSNLFCVFQVMSNEINQPKILVCRQDDDRTYATDFTNFSGTNISYFVGLDADETRPASLLSGDRNITNGTPLQNGILNITTNTPATWVKGRHDGGGNVLLSDGSVQQVTTSGLRQLIANSGLATNRLGMP